jgi:hypothetical protein
VRRVQHFEIDPGFYNLVARSPHRRWRAASTAPPQGVLVRRYFPRRQTVRWRCVEISLSGPPSRLARAAHAPGPMAVMRSPPCQNRASGLREPGTGPSILHRRVTHARRPTAEPRNRLRFAPVHLYRRSVLRALVGRGAARRGASYGWGDRGINGAIGRAPRKTSPFSARRRSVAARICRWRL